MAEQGRSLPPPSASWSYSNAAASSNITLTTAGTAVVWTGGVLDTLLGPGTFDPLTGLYTVDRAGFYEVAYDADFTATQAAGVQRVGVWVNSGAAAPFPHIRHARIRPTNHVGRRSVAGGGLTLALSQGSTIALAAVSDTSADGIQIFAAAMRVRFVPTQMGTAV